MLSDFKELDEPGRLRALLRYAILDTGPEEPFDKILRLVAMSIGVPMCAVSFIDDNRQWFKAKKGLDLLETPRTQSFCTHAIQAPKAFVVPDAYEDSRFAANPYVTGEPHIRAYLGAPLVTPEGYAVGTVCALDVRAP